MLQLEREVKKLTNAYVRHGGKRNRRQQQKRMLEFARHAAQSGATGIGQVGAKHVIRYWRDHRGLAEGTLYNHWRALCILWSLADKSGMPPSPHVS